MQNVCYTDLLLPLPLQGTFTYSVSPEKASGLKPGMRVIVPFGAKKTYTALATRVHDQKPPGFETKEVL
jgi:primosomal protein N' (replication factor Y)